MPDNDQAGKPDGGTVTTTATPATAGASDGATTTTAPDGGSEWRNPAEIGKALKSSREANQKLEQKLDAFATEVRSVLQALKPAEKPQEKPRDTPTADANAAVAELRQELAYKDAVSGLEKPLTKDQRGLLDRLYKAERPPAESLSDWLAKNVSAFGAVNAPATTAPAVTPGAPKVETGPAATPSQDTLPANLLRMTRSQVDGLPRDEFNKRLAEFKQNNGGRRKHLFD